MKKILLLIAVAMTLSLNAQNLITNGDFEGLQQLHQPKPGNTTTDYSNANVNAPYVSANFNWSPGDKEWRLKKSNSAYLQTDYSLDSYSGDQGLILISKKGNTADIAWYNNCLNQSFAVDKTVKYIVKLWAKGNSQFYVQFYANGTNGSAVGLGGQPSKTATENWTQYEFSLDVPAKVEAGANNFITDDIYLNKSLFSLGLVSKAAFTATADSYVNIDDVEVLKFVPTSMEDVKANFSAVYVNSKVVYFNIPEACNVSVYNSLGSLVKKQSIAVGESLPLNDVSNGVYILKVEGSQGTDTHKVLVK